MAKLDRARVRGLGDREWIRVGEALADADLGFMAHQLGVQAGIRFELAMAVLLALVEAELADAEWLVYHSCSDFPLASRPYALGLPSLKDVCDECGQEFEENAFSYDLRFKLREAVEIV